MRGTSLGWAIYAGDVRSGSEDRATATTGQSVFTFVCLTFTFPAERNLAAEWSVARDLVIGNEPAVGRQFDHVWCSHQQNGFPAIGKFPRKRLFTDAVCVLTEQSVIACAAIHAIQRGWFFEVRNLCLETRLTRTGKQFGDREANLGTSLLS